MLLLKVFTPSAKSVDPVPGRSGAAATPSLPGRRNPISYLVALGAFACQAFYRILLGNTPRSITGPLQFDVTQPYPDSTEPEKGQENCHWEPGTGMPVRRDSSARLPSQIPAATVQIPMNHVP